MSERIEQELALYRKAINEIDDRIEYTDFNRQTIYGILDQLTVSLATLHGDPRYQLTDAGRTEADRMRAAMNGKLGGKAKAGEP